MVKGMQLRYNSTFLVRGYRCRCGHEWVNKRLRNSERPRVCPKCKSANWDRDYKFRKTSRKVEGVV